MTIPAPAFDNRPQFDESYWAKVPRKTYRGKIERIQQHPEHNQVEIFIHGGPSFRHAKDDINQLLTPNLNVEVEVINGELVVGLFVVDVKGWAFRMTNKQIAEYAAKLAERVHAQQQAVRREMLERLSALMESTLNDLDFGPEENRGVAARALGGATLRFIEETL